MAYSSGRTSDKSRQRSKGSGRQTDKNRSIGARKAGDKTGRLTDKDLERTRKDWLKP